MMASAVWAGIIVDDLPTSVAWYRDVLPVVEVEEGAGWVALTLDGGSCIELHAGDPSLPGLVFPSYGADSGPPVMAGFGVEDPSGTASEFSVMRVFPDWVVVAAADGMRVVLTDRRCEPGRGLLGFEFTSPDPEALVRLLERVGVEAPVVRGTPHEVVLVVAGEEDRELTDPDGTVLRLTTAR